MKAARRQNNIENNKYFCHKMPKYLESVERDGVASSLPTPCYPSSREPVTFEAKKNDDQLLGKCNKVAAQNTQVGALAWGAKCQALSDKSKRGGVGKGKVMG